MTDLQAAAKAQAQAEKFFGTERRAAPTTAPLSPAKDAVHALQAALQGGYELRRQTDEATLELAHRGYS